MKLGISPAIVLIFDHRGAEKSITLVIGCGALVRPL